MLFSSMIHCARCTSMNYIMHVAQSLLYESCFIMDVVLSKVTKILVCCIAVSVHWGERGEQQQETMEHALRTRTRPHDAGRSGPIPYGLNSRECSAWCIHCLARSMSVVLGEVSHHSLQSFPDDTVCMRQPHFARCKNYSSRLRSDAFCSSQNTEILAPELCSPNM